MRKVIVILLKTATVSVAAVLGLIVISNVSPIYDFEEGQAFSGTEIYNPYARMDTTWGWTRTNLHTHTHATDWINECVYYPDSVKAFYERLGYDFVTFSNHMELTPDPSDTTDQVWVYEHGYNFARFHNLTFNPGKIRYRDMMLPFTISQKQFKMDMLLKDSDFIFFNHPDRTYMTSDEDMRLLSGYRVLEADSDFLEWEMDDRRWDVALSTGHYVTSAISDDLHYPERSALIARRCSFLNMKEHTYSQVKDCLLSGNFYTMQMPDFGKGDREEKIRKNHELPGISSIGLRDGDETYMTLSDAASEIRAIGQNGAVLKSVRDTSAIDYRFTAEDSYVRFAACFDNGCVVMSNPFARWDGGSSTSCTPYRDYAHTVNIPLTILFNLAILAIALLLFFAAAAVIRTGAES